MAEYHWPEVWRVLSSAARADGEHALAAELKQGRGLHKAIQNNGCLVNELFELRRESKGRRGAV